MNINNLNLKPIIIGLVAGEISGDFLGAGLIRTLKKYLKNVRFVGVGGPQMIKENMECWYGIKEFSVMGLVEVIKKLPQIMYFKKKLIQRFFCLKINIFVGIDYPEFNISLEKHLKNYGINTIHYVSPSIWAWRKNRIFKIAQATNNILSVLPFEKKIYDHFDIPCEYIGHPLADEMPLNPNKFSARKELGISNKSLCLALLPGSRINEITMLLGDFLKCAELLNNQFSNLEVLIPLENKKIIVDYYNIKKTDLKFHILDTRLCRKIVTAADISLLASGTATLECMLAKCPMIVAYRMNPLTFQLAKCLVQVPWISLPNLLSGYELVKEFLQDRCCPENLVDTIISLLNNDHNQYVLIKEAFYQLHHLIRCNANEKAAYEVLKLIK